MGKLSRSFLGSALIAFSNATNMEVTNCNNLDTHPTAPLEPALTYRIAEDYFENNLSSQAAADYQHAGGWYTRTVQSDQLAMEFGTNADGNEVIKLSYTVNFDSSGFDLTGGTRIVYGSDSQVFQCQYLRAVTVDPVSFDVAPSTGGDSPIVNTGSIAYDMSVDVPSAGVGGTMTVTITPMHSLNIGALLNQCSVSYDDTSGTTHEVFPIHSFDTSEHGIYQHDADVCYDSSRLDVSQTQFSPDIVFTMRSFRFNVPGSDPNAVQQQSISCDLRLAPVEDVTAREAVMTPGFTNPTNGPGSCDCFTQAECTDAAYVCSRRDVPSDSGEALNGWSYGSLQSDSARGCSEMYILYHIADTLMNYNDAKNYCASIDTCATLFVPRSVCENDYVAALVPGETMWLGINDIDTEGDWVADDHTTLSYFNWGVSSAGQEPNNQNDEDAVTTFHSNDVNGDAHKWNDSQVGFLAKVVCTYRVPSNQSP